MDDLLKILPFLGVFLNIVANWLKGRVKLNIAEDETELQARRNEVRSYEVMMNRNDALEGENKQLKERVAHLEQVVITMQSQINTLMNGGTLEVNDATFAG